MVTFEFTLIGLTTQLGHLSGTKCQVGVVAALQVDQVDLQFQISMDKISLRFIDCGLLP